MGSVIDQDRDCSRAKTFFDHMDPIIWEAEIVENMEEESPFNAIIGFLHVNFVVHVFLVANEMEFEVMH